MHGQSYQVANGEEIDNEGEKRFVEHMVTVEGADSGGKGITAQVCKGSPTTDVGQKDLQDRPKSSV